MTASTTSRMALLRGADIGIPGAPRPMFGLSRSRARPCRLSTLTLSDNRPSRSLSCLPRVPSHPSTNAVRTSRTRGSTQPHPSTRRRPLLTVGLPPRTTTQLVLGPTRTHRRPTPGPGFPHHPNTWPRQCPDHSLRPTTTLRRTACPSPKVPGLAMALRVAACIVPNISSIICATALSLACSPLLLAEKFAWHSCCDTFHFS